MDLEDDFRIATASTSYSPKLAMWSSHSVSSKTVPEACDLITALALVQNLRFDLLPLHWHQASSTVGLGGTASIRQLPLDILGTVVFKVCRDAPLIEKMDQHDQGVEVEKALKVFVNELVLLSIPRIRSHQNISQAIGVSFQLMPSGRVWPVITSPRAKFGNLELFSRSQRGKVLTMTDTLCIVDGICAAINELHYNCAFHGDIKPQNIVVDLSSAGQLIPQLIDFGYSGILRSSNQDGFKLSRTEPWHAPEWEPNRLFSLREAQCMDKYSLGLCIMWFVFHNNSSCAAGHTASKWIMEKRNSSADMLATANNILAEADGFLENDKKRLQLIFSECLSAQATRFHRIVASNESLAGGDPSTAGPSPDESFFTQTENTMISIPSSFNQLYELHINVRRAIRAALFARSKAGDSEATHDDLYFQLAICSYLGFGTDQNDNEADEYLRASGKSKRDLQLCTESMAHSQISYESDTFRECLDAGNMAQIEQVHFSYQSMDKQAYTSYKCEITNISMKLGPTCDVALRLQQQLLHICMECDEHGEAEIIARDLRNIFNSRISPTNENDLACLAASGTLALTIEAQGRYDEAESILLSLLRCNVPSTKADERSSSPLRFHNCRTLGNLAHLYKAKGDYEKAASFFRQTMDIYKAGLGAQHPLSLVTAADLLRMYIVLGNTVKAEQLVYDTKRVIRTDYEGRNAEIWELIILISRMHAIQDQNVDALRILEEALEKDDGDLEEGAPENDLRLVAISKIASINFMLGKQDEAHKACRRLREEYLNRKLSRVGLKPEVLCRAIPDYYHDGMPFGAQYGTTNLAEEFKSDIESACGTSSDLTRTAYTQVARQYYNQGRLDAAVKLYEKSITDASQSPPLLGPRIAVEDMRSGWKPLAVVRKHFGKATQERQKRQIIDDLKRCLKGHPSTKIVALEALAEIHQLLNRSSDAAVYFEVTLNLSQELYGPRSIPAAQIMISLAHLYHDQNMTTNSKALLTEARTLLQSIGFNEAYAFVAWHNFASLIRRLGYFEEAQHIHVALISAHENRLGSDHEKVLAAKNNTATCLYKMGKKEECERYLRDVLETSGNQLGSQNPQLSMAESLLKALLEEKRPRYFCWPRK